MHGMLTGSALFEWLRVSALLIAFKFPCATLIAPNEDLLTLTRSTVVNPHEFKYLQNPGGSVCGASGGAGVALLVYVHSTPENLLRRLSIRETWARRSMFKELRLVFMLGESRSGRVRGSVALEARYYNDIVQEDFEDSYRNLTYKGRMLFVCVCVRRGGAFWGEIGE
jgi:hypothetical protein